MQKRKIIFRADGSINIGMGHFVRSLALAEMLHEDFYAVFATRNPTDYQRGEVARICEELWELSDNHFDDFLSKLCGDEIVVLDNYFFDTDYQRKIRSKGCKLICIDDMHDKHYVADIVVNHAPGFTNDDFSVESYTQLCLGLDWAMLRKPFLDAKPLDIKEKGHCVVAFGGADWHNLTEKIARELSTLQEVNKITAIVGDAYAFIDTLQDIDKVEVCKNLTAQQIADLFCSVEFAVLSVSTICIEALACGCPVMGGYYVDNQKEAYESISQMQLIVGLGDLLELKNIPYSWRESLHKLSAINRPLIIKDKYKMAVEEMLGLNFTDEGLQFKCYTELTLEQHEEVWIARNHYDVRRWMTNNEPFDFDSHLNFVSSLPLVDGDKFYWAVFKKDNYVGSVDLNPYNRIQKTGEWGIFLAPKYIGTGIGLALEFVFMNFLFYKWGMTEVFAKVKLDNNETLHLQQKIGFKLINQDDQWYDLSCTRERWMQQPKTLKIFKQIIFSI